MAGTPPSPPSPICRPGDTPPAETLEFYSDPGDTPPAVFVSDSESDFTHSVTDSEDDRVSIITPLGEEICRVNPRSERRGTARGESSNRVEP